MGLEGMEREKWIFSHVDIHTIIKIKVTYILKAYLSILPPILFYYRIIYCFVVRTLRNCFNVSCLAVVSVFLADPVGSLFKILDLKASATATSTATIRNPLK